MLETLKELLGLQVMESEYLPKGWVALVSSSQYVFLGPEGQIVTVPKLLPLFSDRPYIPEDLRPDRDITS